MNGLLLGRRLAAGALLAAATLATVPASFAEDTATPGTVVGAPGVNVRACAGADCPVAFSLALGDRLTVTGEAQNGWLPVSRGGASGWVWNLYLRPDGAAAPWLLRGPGGCQRVAFLFNLGVGYELQLSALEWLAEQDIPATVFPMGWWAEANPEKLRRIAELGFEIGSHGDARQELTTLGDEAVRADIAAAEAAIEAVTGDPVAPLFTPYAAASDERVRGLIAQAGYLPVGWEVPADDWDFGVTADDVFMNVVPNVTDGAIVEFHLDGPASAESTAVALPWIVERLRAEGFAFVAVGDIALACPAGLPSAAAAAVATP